MADTKEITVQGVTVNVSTPYAEGHTCSAAEAKALNQVRAENIRNNTASHIKKLKEDHGDDEAALQSAADQIVSEYDKNYEFTLASVGGGRTPVDPVEKEAKAVAREYISMKLKEAGITQKAYKEANGEESINEKIAELAENPEVVKMAKQRIKERENNAKLAGALEL